VHRHDDAMPLFGMTEDLMASSDSIELPAAPLQRAHRCRGVTAGSRGVTPKR
jgi:hypothetical protein